VGTDAFTPPELIRKNFKSILRTFENEYFTVAVLMFMILMYGKHPYSKVGGGNLKN
jgi:DNA-binding helix-hairpin-helix protein with protein kinase domain